MSFLGFGALIFRLIAQSCTDSLDLQCKMKKKLGKVYVFGALFENAPRINDRRKYKIHDVQNCRRRKLQILKVKVKIPKTLAILSGL